MLPSVFQYSPELARLLYKQAEPYRSPDPNDTGDPADEEDRQLPRHPALHAVKAVGAGLAGTGAGVMLGRGAYELGRDVMGRQRDPARAVMAGASAVGGLAGLAFGLYQHKTMEELNRALEAHRNKSTRPGV